MGKSKKRQKFTKLDPNNVDSILQGDSAKEKETKCNNSNHDLNHVTTQFDSVLNQDNHKNLEKEVQLDNSQSEFNTEESSVTTSTIKYEHTKNNLQKFTVKEKKKKCNHSIDNELTTQFHNLSTIDNLQEGPDKEIKIDENQSKLLDNTEQTSEITSTMKNDLIKNNPQENSREKNKKSKLKRTNQEKNILSSSNISKNNGSIKHKSNNKADTLPNEENANLIELPNNTSTNRSTVKKNLESTEPKHNQISTEVLPGDNEKSLEYEELDEDLFKLGNEYAFAHCVAEDLRMGAGIAVEFKRNFGCLGKLFDQNLRVGDVGVLNHKNQFIFYLVTKKYSNGKPTLDSLKRTLVKLRDEMGKNNLTKLAIPKLGCGLDGLDWLEVQNCIKDIFYGSGIHITVCVPSLSKITDKKMSKALNIYTTPRNLWEMEAGTDIILFLDKNDLKQCKLDGISDKINTRYPFKDELLKDMNIQRDKYVFEYNRAKERILCIMKHSKNYYDTLEQIFRNDISKIKKFKTWKYYALQFENCVETKRIIEIIRSVFHSGVSELWLCGIEDHPESTYYDVYCRSLRQTNVFNNSSHLKKKYSEDHKTLKVNLET